VAKNLKNSTRKLCRQLQDNPDVDGNRTLIKTYKKSLQIDIDQLMNEMYDAQTFSNFKNTIDKAIEENRKFDEYRNQEKQLNNEIKDINEKLKQKQDDIA
jgi:hypothetical protein